MKEAAPIGFSGFMLRIFVHLFCPQKNFSHLSSPLNQLIHKDKNVFTLASANVLLANEAFCRVNNTKNPVLRSQLIGYKLMFQSNNPLQNLDKKTIDSKEDCVITDLPDVDVLCLQEVWERYWASALIAQLKMKYTHIIYDVRDFGLGSKFCLFGSGLFVASKYPVEAADFKAFQCPTHHVHIFTYGVLNLKLRIHDNQVGYVTNLHLQANRDKPSDIYHQLSETLSAVNAFRARSHRPDDEVVFDTICGDFNFDYISIGNAVNQRHPLFHQYFDFCSKNPGQDHSWTIGTELRQQKMHEASVSNPQHFRNVLVNDVQRRHYVLDADVVALADPAQIKKGESGAGKRRVDRILLRKDRPVEVKGYAFSTVLAGLTDHIPVVMSVQSNQTL